MYVARLQQVPPVIALLVPNSTPSTIVNIVFSNIAFVYQESQFLLDYNYGLHYTPLRIPTEVMPSFKRMIYDFWGKPGYYYFARIKTLKTPWQK